MQDNTGPLHLSIDSYINKTGERIIEELTKLDLGVNDAKILLYLMLCRVATAADISRDLDLTRPDTYRHLSLLVSKGLVFFTFDRPQRYRALPYNEAIDLLVRAKQDVLGAVMKSKEDYSQKIADMVGSLALPTLENVQSYQVIMDGFLKAKLNKLFSDMKKEVLMLLSDNVLFNLNSYDITDSIQQLRARKIRVSMRVSSKETASYAEKEFGEGVQVEISDRSPVSYIIVDNDLVLLFDNAAAMVENRHIYGFYTNNPALIAAFRLLYEKLAELAR